MAESANTLRLDFALAAAAAHANVVIEFTDADAWVVAHGRVLSFLSQLVGERLYVVYQVQRLANKLAPTEGVWDTRAY
jgi:fructose-specific component phosphotransferase system IIB-like protein